MKEGYVDRILTTNFDPLIIRACALLNEFPAIYDFGSSHTYQRDHIANKSVFYLHGQYNGFVMLNTGEELDKQKKPTNPLLKKL